MSTNPYAPIFFYSQKVEDCKELIGILQTLNKASLFRFVCIDTTPRHLIPPEVKAVPCILNPQNKEVITGKNAIMTLISKPVQGRRDVPVQKSGPPPATEPGAWSFGSAASFTDPYTTIDGATTMPDDQLYFSYLGASAAGLAGGDAGPVRPGGEESGGGSKTGRNNDVSSRLEEYNNTRNSEFAGIKRT